VPAPEQQAVQPQSLYRRHRPRTFAKVVGQEPIVRTLRNAVQRDKVHHAYLFVGSRGTGKTSMAKILAACLNCERGPTVEPCGQCESCISIAAASSLDVIELDAASSNSVDDIRELRESVAYAPVSGRRKIYILDEAHMLSTAAWNAFLKTLEEPPPSTVFVLATTEAQKVPATVIDRCHRFDFQRPTVEQIAAVVTEVAGLESIEIPPAAVAAIARAAAGSFRDALGTLEQLVTYSGPTIALEDALAVLGVADAALLQSTVDAVAGGDAAAALRAVDQCAGAGRDAASFASDLERHVRELLVVGTLGEVPAELSLTPEADQALAAQAKRTERAVLVRLLELLGEAMEAVRAGADARTRLELALVKAARPELDSSSAALRVRIERLERRDQPPEVASQAEGEPERSAVAQSPESAPAPVGTASSSETAALAQAGPLTEKGASPQNAAARETGASNETGARPRAHQAAQRVDDGEAARTTADGAQGDQLDSLRAAWPAVVELVREQNALLGALIEEAEPVAVAGAQVTVAFPAGAPFLKKKAEDPANRRAVGDALCSVLAGRWTLCYALGEESGDSRRHASEEDWIKRLMEEFDAEEVAPEQPVADAADAVAARGSSAGGEREAG
jgi:DNA polymerase-3 subunit gamma/tau